MKLSFSNIGWEANNDDTVYALLVSHGFSGLEIAPTRLFEMPVYEKLSEAKAFSEKLLDNYALTIPSMQSIWFGKTQSIFGTQDEREDLIAYTKQAVDFAAAMNCKSLVFGCPKNRNMPIGADITDADDFFAAIGQYAKEKGTAIALEANPTIYNTNFLNTTKQVLEYAKRIGHGLKVNLDFGTIIQNQESIEIIADCIEQVSHIHISEPYLVPIQKREQHKELAKLLKQWNYSGYVSAEMKVSDTATVIGVMDYMEEVFG